MLHHAHLITALNNRRDDFAYFDDLWQKSINSYANKLNSINSKSSSHIRELASRSKSPGALPSEELDQHKSVVIQFEEKWRSHEEARRWAINVLKDHTTFAADGSQFLPGKEFSIPTAAVQVATFENPHKAEGTYKKDTRLLIITPNELLENEDSSQADFDSIVSLRRFEEEVSSISTFLKERKGWRGRGEKIPVAFFDGSLLISHTHSRTHTQHRYVNSILKLIELSYETEIPVIGYIDQSYARDIVNLLEILFDLEKSPSIYDAQVLCTSIGNSRFLERWGDRTSFHYCLRSGITEDFIDKDNEPLIGFVYLQTTSNNPPARLDLPSWIYRAGLLNEVIDIVRAECVVGNGYPYAIETADAAAVITLRDREIFMHAIEEFAKREKLRFNLSRKSISKAHRR